MKIKSVPVTAIKAGPDDGLAEGQALVYPATFTRTPDSYGDVIAKGAFAETIRKWKESGDVMPGMYLHDPNQIVAYAVDMGEDDHGWWVKAQFDDDPAAQKIYRLVKGRRLSALSFAYDTIDEGAVQVDGGVKANELRQVDALEFSFLPKGFAANADTSVVAVKSLTDALVRDVEQGRLTAELIDSLRKTQEALAAVLAASDDQEGKASGEPEAKSDASDEEPCVRVLGKTCPRHGVEHWREAKLSASDEEPAASPSVDPILAAISIREKGVA